MKTPVQVRYPGLVAYDQALREMQAFNDARTTTTTDELWFLEHPPVYTLGINAAEEHLGETGNTPVVRVDRGGQVTWHGPGQLVMYVLLDLKRKKLGVRELVCRLEKSIIGTLADYDIPAAGREGAPGVYTRDAKIASIGLRVRHHCCYHGIALNVATDLAAFERINPCGYEGLAVTQTADEGGPTTVSAAADALLPHVLEQLGLERAPAAT